MFRRLLTASVASLGLLSPMALTSQTNAHEYRHEPRHEYRHEWHHGYRQEHACRVFYRDPCRPGWVCAGSFCYHREAERCAEQYRCRGFAVEIR
jgi:hypothetical protein